ncbi:MAG: PrsW family glutamic-type intramembrane protease [Spirochaetia bacterium]|jgi:RsiW-degrading membrane proteinase PrsW (M82 family)|nr:PrsW family glutamic-type intramembrane protease [Spirochaetia bacterium]
MIDIAVLVAGAALPAVVLLVLFYRADRARPEPLGLLGKSVLYGFLATIPAIGLELIVDIPASVMPGMLGILWTSFITAAAVEEGVKYFFLKRYLLHNPAFNEVMDGIVYAACVSLGFAFAENLMYGLEGGLVLVFRAFTAVPMHAAATGIMGFYLGMSKRVGDHKEAIACRRKGFWAAMLVHGLYDFFLFSGFPLLLGAIATLFVAVRILRSLIRKARHIDDAAAIRSAASDAWSST